MRYLPLVFLSLLFLAGCPVVVEDEHHHRPPVIIEEHHRPPVIIEEHRRPPIIIEEHHGGHHPGYRTDAPEAETK